MGVETLADLDILFMLMPIMAKRKHTSALKKARKSKARSKISPGNRKGKIAPDQASGASPSPKPVPKPAGAKEAEWIYGIHAVLAALANPSRPCYRLLVASTVGKELSEKVAQAQKPVSGRPAIETVDRSEIGHILHSEAVHQGLALLAGPLPRVAIEDVIKTTTANGSPDGNEIIIVLDQATDPRNIGAVLRSAAAFGAKAVIVQDRHAPRETGTLCKAASGATEWVPVVRAVNLARAITALKDAGFWCVGLDPTAEQTLAGAGLSGRVALVLGAEGHGLRRLTRETCDGLVRVPLRDGTESLNLSNAAAVALYELARRRP